MKVALSVSGETPAAAIDPRFGRSPGFLVVDLVSGASEYVTNTQNLRAAQGAGIQAAQNVVNAGAQAVLTGHCGPKAFRVLQAAGVAIYLGAEGTAAQALDRLRAGDWEACEDADVEGHWV